MQQQQAAICEFVYFTSTSDDRKTDNNNGGGGNTRSEMVLRTSEIDCCSLGFRMKNGQARQSFKAYRQNKINIFEAIRLSLIHI